MKKRIRLWTSIALVTCLLLSACAQRTKPLSETQIQIADGDTSQEEIATPLPQTLEYARVLTANPVNIGSKGLDSLDLSFPQTFAVTRPTEKLTTSLETYFITGTSDPNLPLYIGGEEIQRQGSKGTFGVHVNLALGTNLFTLSQGDKTTAVTIIRTPKPGVSAISTITQESMYPAIRGSVKVGEELFLECTAPSGGSVTASFGGQTATLQQVAQAASGIPAVFRGSMVVSGEYPSDSTTKSGKVTYTLSYNGSTKSYQSTGEVYVAGKNSDVAVSVTSYYGFLYNDPKNQADFRGNLKTGSVEYVQSQDNSFYHLRSGGYLPVDQAVILEGAVSIDAKLKEVAAQAFQKSEVYTFATSTTPAFFTKRGDGTFALTLFNTSGTPKIDLSSSKLFSDVAVTDNGTSVSYVFTLKNSGSLWGYNVYYDGTNTVLRCGYKPRVTSGLDGVTVVLDPGHGGDEKGALGVAGKSGPSEATINLAHVLATKQALESMGATVLVTRTDNRISLDDRLKYLDNSGGDIFVSLHHNSLVESTDANKVAGMEVYYHTPNSQNFSNNLMNALAINLNRNNRGVKQSYYRVTLSTYAPSLLLELAYISNPAEYERATDPTSIQRAGEAVALSIKQALS